MIITYCANCGIEKNTVHVPKTNLCRRCAYFKDEAGEKVKKEACSRCGETLNSKEDIVETSNEGRLGLFCRPCYADLLDMDDRQRHDFFKRRFRQRK